MAAVLDTAGGLVVVLDPKGHIVRFNRACERLTGYTYSEVRGKPFWDLFLLPEDLEPVRAVVAELNAGQFPNEYENYWLTRSGDRRMIAWTNTVLVDDNGAVEYTVATGIDVTERRQAEAALRRAHDELELRVTERTAELARANKDLRSEVAERQRAEAALLTQFKQFSSIFDSLNAVVYVADMQTHELLFLNSYGAELFGAGIGRKCFHVLQSAQTDACDFCTNHLLVRDGLPQPPYVWEFQNTVTGRWFQCIDRAMHWTDGRLVRMEIAVDITDRKQIEEERERWLGLVEEQNRHLQSQFEQIQAQNEELQAQSEEIQAQNEEAERRAAELDTIIQSIADAVIIFGLAEEPVHMNLAAERMLGYSLAEYRLPAAARAGLLRMENADGKPLALEDSPTMRAQRGETVRGMVMRFHLHEGRNVWVSASAAPIRTSNDQIVGAVVTLTDITRLHELQEQGEQLLAQVQQNRQSMEEMVRLISHDLRNPLTVVMGQGDRLQRMLTRQGPEPAAEGARSIVKSARQMNAMIQDLVESTRLESGNLELQKQPTDLVQLIGDVTHRIGSLEESARVRVEPAFSELVAPVDASRVERAVVNLITNALKYSPPEAPVTVRLAWQDGEASISVVDQGVGIPDEDVPHLFERFFRAKSGKKADGLGLGLYITRLIVEAHGGRMSVESAVGKGSTFAFTLPLV